MAMGLGEKREFEAAVREVAKIAEALRGVVEKLAVLEERVAAIEAKRGPGRPPKQEQE